ncbi:MAG: PIG-L deacetylase family protein [Chloroflexota bacterium]
MAKVMVIAAHPDDESGFAGGYLAKLAKEGNDLYIVEVTRGEGGEVGVPPVGPKSRLGEYREEEMKCAAAALGARELRFLGFIDPSIEIGEPPKPIEAGMAEFASAVAQQIADVRPDVIITHGSNGEYGHPQHIYTFEAVREALRRLAPWYPTEMLTWCANDGDNAEDRLTNRSDPADLVLDISPWLDRKVAAAMCHRSQHDMFLRNSKAGSVAEMVRRIEAFKRWNRAEFLSQEPATGNGEATSDWRLPAPKNP